MASADIWDEVVKKQAAILKNTESRNFGHLVLVKDFKEFEASLTHICNKYAQKNVSKFISDKLAPHFDHIKSFTSAVSSSAQANVCAMLLWGALQVVIEVWSPFTSPVFRSRFRFASGDVHAHRQICSTPSTRVKLASLRHPDEPRELSVPIKQQRQYYIPGHSIRPQFFCTSA
jgi:hypothetical protein